MAKLRSDIELAIEVMAKFLGWPECPSPNTRLADRDLAWVAGRWVAWAGVDGEVGMGSDQFEAVISEGDDMGKRLVRMVVETSQSCVVPEDEEF